MSSCHQRSINTAVRATLSQILGDLTLQLRHRQENTVSHVSWQSFIKHKHKSIISYYAALWNMLSDWLRVALYSMFLFFFSAKVSLDYFSFLDFSYISRMLRMNWCYKSVWLGFYRVLMVRNIAYLSTSAKVCWIHKPWKRVYGCQAKTGFSAWLICQTVWFIIFHNHFHSSTGISHLQMIAAVSDLGSVLKSAY